ncbi:MAG: Na+/H+ antiporter NhaC family protein [Peptoniphilus grossensis]
METKELLFNLPPIVGLLPLLLYVFLSFKKNTNAVVNVGICVILGAILVKQPILELGDVIKEAMGSFLALVGLIIMLGSGLGSVLRTTGIAENIVHFLMDKIGINTERKAILATMLTSVILVTLLGTLAGANAVIAPIVISLVAAVGITPSTLAVIFQGAGQAGLFLSPFSPPMVTLKEITGLTYGQVLMYAGIPVALSMWIVTYFVAKHAQKSTKGISKFDLKEFTDNKEYKPTKQTNRATIVFLLSLFTLLVFGVVKGRGASYAIFIMITVAMLTGLSYGLKAKDIAEDFFEGMQKMVWMFCMFILFEPFLRFVEASGAFTALFELLEPLVISSGQVITSVVIALIGVFGINGAAVAQAVLMDNLFGEMIRGMGMHMGLWCLLVLVGHQITSFAYPGVDMLGAMGLAQSKDIKSMLKLGYSIILVTMTLVVIMAIIL